MREVIEVITVPRIGNGTKDDPIRPDTTAIAWDSIEVTETTYTIKIYAEG